MSKSNPQKKIFFLTLPAYGHINPSLNIIRELQQQGFQVICYSLDEFKPLLESTGAEYRQYKYKKYYDASISRNVWFLGKILVKTAKDLLPSILEDCERDKPICIIHDALALWGKVVSRTTGIPGITVCCTLVYTNKLMLRYPSLFLRSLKRSGKETLFAYINQNSLYRQYHAKSPGLNDLFVNKEPLNIIFTSSSFHPCAESFDETFKFVGPSIAPRPSKTSVNYPKDKKIIYISLGTVINNDIAYFNKLLDIFSHVPYAVIISLGKRFTPDDFTAIPSHIQLKTYVNQLEVLQHADLFITHAGLNGINESLYYGVPMVLIPDTEEQTALALRVQELKAGIMLNKDNISKNILLKAVNKVLSDKNFTEQAIRLQKLLRTTGGYKEATKEIINYTGTC